MSLNKQCIRTSNWRVSAISCRVKKSGRSLVYEISICGEQNGLNGATAKFIPSAPNTVDACPLQHPIVDVSRKRQKRSMRPTRTDADVAPPSCTGRVGLSGPLANEQSLDVAKPIIHIRIFAVGPWPRHGPPSQTRDFTADVDVPIRKRAR